MKKKSSAAPAGKDIIMTTDSLFPSERRRLAVFGAGLGVMALMLGGFSVVMFTLMLLHTINWLIVVTCPVLLFIAVLLVLVSRKYLVDALRNIAVIHTGTVSGKTVSKGSFGGCYVHLPSGIFQLKAAEFDAIDEGDRITIRTAPLLGATLSVQVL